MDDLFKLCPNCRKQWRTQNSFLSDCELELNGYKADFEKLEQGMFFFTHKKEACLSTMVIEVRQFLNLYDGPIYPERKTGLEACSGYCMDTSRLDRCEAFCEYAFVREIISIIKAWPRFS